MRWLRNYEVTEPGTYDLWWFDDEDLKFRSNEDSNDFDLNIYALDNELVVDGNYPDFIKDLSFWVFFGPKEKINYNPIPPEELRQIFINETLIKNIIE